jgi:predicted RNase H-like HicB family nuclease
MKKTNIQSVKKARVKGYTLELYHEPDPGENGYKMYAEVKELGGCYIAGDSEKEILAEAPDVIDVYLDAQKELSKQKPKLVSVKMKPELYALVSRYAQDQGIENVSTLMRSLVVKKLREDGYYSSSRLAATH